jgi:hypothetical protein
MRLAVLALALCGSLVAGCETMKDALPHSLRPAANADRAPTTGTELVAYLARLRGMNERGLAAEAQRQRELARGAPNDLAQVKIAIALSLAPQSDEGDILALVEPVLRREAAEDDLRAMASFLQVQAAERRRLKESAAAAGVRLRDERRATEAQKQRADTLQERAAQLQQKLDALSEIEKNLSDRQSQGK